MLTNKSKNLDCQLYVPNVFACHKDRCGLQDLCA